MRLGRPGSSEFHKIVTPGGKLSKQAEEYAYTLLAESMMGHPIDSVATQWMIRGQELEDAAIHAYEFETGMETSPGGIVTNDAGTYGCSPDRLVGDCGVLEIKCPAPNTHVSYLISPESMEKEKTPQVQGQLLCSERMWVDLVSYHPEMPTVIHRVVRDEKYIDLLRTALNTFVELLLLLRAQLEDKYGQFPKIVMPEDRPVPADDLGVSDADVSALIANGAITFTE
jgi:exodeoxyribonuclease (lambda-induced)